MDQRPGSDSDLPLWRAVLPRLAVTSRLPEWRDRVEEAFAELYLLGERPSEAELRSALEDLEMGASWVSEVLRVWRRRVRDPARQPKALRQGCPWVRPFYISEQAVDEHGLRPISDRLADSAAAAVADYLSFAETEPGSDATHAAEEHIALTVRAVQLWGRARDAAEGAWWPSLLPTRRRLVTRVAEGATRTGQARYAEHVEQLRREREEDEARYRKRGLLDDD